MAAAPSPDTTVPAATTILMRTSRTGGLTVTRRLLLGAPIVALLAVVLAAAPIDAAKGDNGGGGGGKPGGGGGGGGTLANPALAYISEGAVWLSTADGSATQQLTLPEIADRHPAWNPAQPAEVGFARRPSPDYGCSDFYTINADGTGETLVYDFYTAFAASGGSTPCLGDGNRPWDWSPDGTKIAFVSNWGTGVPVVYVLDLAAGSYAALTSDYVPGGPPVHPPSSGVSWSPDGSTIAYHSWVDGATGDDIFLVDVATGAVNNLTPWAQAQRTPVWSSDGAQIAYWGDDNPRTLNVMNADGTSPHVVAMFDHNLSVEPVTWSPDDALFAFTQLAVLKGNKVTRDLFSIGAGGAGLANLTNSRPDETNPDWNPSWVDGL